MMAKYKLRLFYQLPKIDRLKRIAVVKPRANDIFISYAAQDGDFVRRLDQAIRDRGLDPWIDFDDIPDFNQLSVEDPNIYNQQIKAGILRADVFILVLPTTALYGEKNIQELKLAQRLNKLIVLLGRDNFDDFDALPLIREDLHCLALRSPFTNHVFEQVARNIIHLQTYVRLLARSTEWDKKGRPQQYLLTPEDLKVVKKQKLWIETHRLGEQFKFTKIQKVFLETVDRVHETSEVFGKSPPDIFISYARRNHNFVERLSQLLKDRRWKIWIDRDRIPVAANWKDEAEEGIRYSHTVIFVICSDSLLSKNCQWEFEKAKQYKKRIIPVISDEKYNREIFRAMGLSSVQYVSFIRENQSFEQPLQQLLDALKENLKDLKIYRRLLIKAYEWSDRDRADGFLMSRHEYKEIQDWSKQREKLIGQDNRDVEPLLSRQREYIQSTQRYLDSQRRRQSLHLSMVLATLFGLSGLLLGSTFSEIKALVKSLDNLKELDALVIAIQAGKRVQYSDLFVQSLQPNLRFKATTALHRTALKLREINRLDEHAGAVLSIMFSPDAQKLVSLGADDSIRFWNLDKDFVEHSQIHAESVVTAAYNPDGKIIATGLQDGVVKLWGSDGQLLQVLKKSHAGTVKQVVFSPGGQYLVSGGVDGKIFLWTQEDEFDQPIVLTHGIGTKISAIVFSARGNYFASADLEGGIKLWDLSGDSIEEFSPKGLVPSAVGTQRDTDAIFTMQFSPDGSLLAFSGKSGVIQIYNLTKETIRRLAGHDDSVYQLAFSSDGSTLASASADGTVKLWKPRLPDDKALAHTLRGHQGAIYRVKFAPRDDVVATGGADGVVRLWLTAKGTLVDSFEGHKDVISSLAFSPKSSLGRKTILASSSNDGDIRLWNIESPIQPLPHSNRVFDVAFRPDGKVVASSGLHTIRLWRKEEATLRSHIEFGQDSKVYTLDYRHPDGEVLAAGGSNGQLKLWQPDVMTTKPIQTFPYAHPVSNDQAADRQGVLDLSFSPNGAWMASGGADRTLKLWGVGENSLIQQYMSLPQAHHVTGVAFSGDSRFLAVSIKADSDADSMGISLWEVPENAVEGLHPIRRFRTTEGHEGTVATVAINPQDSDVIASGGVDGKVNLWTASGELIKTLDAHSEPITQVAFSEDGLFLASSSNDGTIILWTSQGSLVSVLERHERAVSSVEFGPGRDSGEVLISSSFDADVLLWKLWDLSNVGMTVKNQNQKILKMLVLDGCNAVGPFLETHQRRQTDGAISQELNASEQESLREIQDIKDFCDSQ